MLNIIFGYSKYYVDNLSENVRRGLRTKIRSGWHANQAPTGYRNCKETRTVVPDGEQFAMVQEIFSLLLSGCYSVSQVHGIVRSRNKVCPAPSSVYNILRNPFYAGYIRSRGQLYPGAHTPAVSKADFEKAQAILSQARKTRPRRLRFDYSSVFSCSACGFGVSAERKIKPSGREYTYYHCTQRGRGCAEPSIEGRELERQIVAFLGEIELPPQPSAAFQREIEIARTELVAVRAKARQAQTQTATDLKRQISNLTDMRLQELIPADEFTRKRQQLERQVNATAEKIKEVDGEIAMFEPLTVLHILLSKARSWLTSVVIEEKRVLLLLLCSNPTIRDRKAILSARNPLSELIFLHGFTRHLTDVKNGGTNPIDVKVVRTEFQTRLQDFLADPETRELAKDARRFIERVEPALLAGNDNNALLPQETERSKPGAG